MLSKISILAPLVFCNYFNAINFSTKHHNFGQVEKNQVLNTKIIITNSSDTNLVIKKIEVECNCVEVFVSKNQIIKGDTASLDVYFHTLKYFGETSRNIFIITNQKPELSILKITANVK
jgi:hypothetical protein